LVDAHGDLLLTDLWKVSGCGAIPYQSGNRTFSQRLLLATAEQVNRLTVHPKQNSADD
jgi:hypothetical protein